MAVGPLLAWCSRGWSAGAHYLYRAGPFPSWPTDYCLITYLLSLWVHHSLTSGPCGCRVDWAWLGSWDGMMTTPVHTREDLRQPAPRSLLMKGNFIPHVIKRQPKILR